LSRKPAQAIKSFDGQPFHVAARRGFAATIAAAVILIRQKFQPDECRTGGGARGMRMRLSPGRH